MEAPQPPIVSDIFFLEFSKERQGPLENQTERDEKSLKEGKSGVVFDFQQKRSQIVKKRDRHGGERKYSVIASASVEAWQIAEYFFTHLSDYSKAFPLFALFVQVIFPLSI